MLLSAEKYGKALFMEIKYINKIACTCVMQVKKGEIILDNELNTWIDW